jgi:hypothetical protein
MVVVRMMVGVPMAAFSPEENCPKQQQQRNQAYDAENNKTFAGGRSEDTP